MIINFFLLISLSLILFLILYVLPLQLKKHHRTTITILSFLAVGFIIFSENFIRLWQTIVILFLTVLLYSTLVARQTKPLEENTYTFSNLSTKKLLVHVNGAVNEVVEEKVIVEEKDENEAYSEIGEGQIDTTKVEEDPVTKDEDKVSIGKISSYSQFEEVLNDVNHSVENKKEEGFSHFENNAFVLDEINLDTEDATKENEGMDEQSHLRKEFGSSDRIKIEKDSLDAKKIEYDEEPDDTKSPQQGQEHSENASETTEYHYIDELKTIDDLFAQDEKENNNNKDKLDLEKHNDESWISKDDSNGNQSYSFLELFSEDDLKVTNKEQVIRESKKNELETSKDIDEFEVLEVIEEIKEQKEKQQNEVEKLEELSEVLNEISVQEVEEKVITSETTEMEVKDFILSDLSDSFTWKVEDTKNNRTGESNKLDNMNGIEMIDLTFSSEDDLENEFVNHDEEDGQSNTLRSVEELKGLNKIEEIKQVEKDLEEDLKEDLKSQINILNDIKFDNATEIQKEEKLDEDVTENYSSIEFNDVMEKQSGNTEIVIPKTDKNIQSSAGEQKFNDELIEDEFVYKGIHSLHRKSQASMEDLIAELNHHEDKPDENLQLSTNVKDTSKVNSEVFLAPLEDDEEDVEEDLRKSNYERNSRTFDDRLPRLKKYKKKWWQVWK
jgi:hypothetical protein